MGREKDGVTRPAEMGYSYFSVCNTSRVTSAALCYNWVSVRQSLFLKPPLWQVLLMLCKPACPSWSRRKRPDAGLGGSQAGCSDGLTGCGRGRKEGPTQVSASQLENSFPRKGCWGVWGTFSLVPDRPELTTGQGRKALERWEHVNYKLTVDE